MMKKSTGKWHVLSESKNGMTWLALIIVSLVAQMGSSIVCF